MYYVLWTNNTYIVQLLLFIANSEIYSCSLFIKCSFIQLEMLLNVLVY